MLIGAATVLVVLVAVFLSYNANQGLPFVPTYPLKARDAERGEPRARQRGADRRHARRLGRRDRASSGATTARASPCSASSSSGRSTPLPKDSTVLDPAALGARPEVRRADARHVRRGLRGRRHDPARAGHARARRVRRVHEHVRRGHARRRAGEPARASATRSPAAATSLNQAIGAFRPLLRDIIPVAQNLSSAETNLPRFIGDAGRRRAHRRARGRERRRSCSSTSTARSPRCATVARPYIQESISEGPETLDAAIEGFPRPAAVPGQHRGPVPRAAAGRARAARRRARPRRRARDRHADAAAARRRSTAGSRRC